MLCDAALLCLVDHIFRSVPYERVKLKCWLRYVSEYSSFFFMMSEVVVAIQEEETLDDIFLTIYY